MRLEPFDTQRHMVFSRRATVFGGGASLLFLGLGARLYQLQINEHDNYQALAEDNRFNQKIIMPLRGEIFDRFGKAVATSRQNFQVLMVPEDAGDVERVLREVADVLGLDQKELARIRKDAARQRSFTPVSIADNISWDQFARLNFLAPRLPGLRSEVAATRDYPLGPSGAFVVGYVGAPNERDLDQAESEETRLLLRQPGFRIGRAGIERRFDEKLRGEAGSVTVQINAHGRVIEEYPNLADQPVQGQPIGLTIDAELQEQVSKILAATNDDANRNTDHHEMSASAVVMDVHSGDILVYASVPAFDPNEFNIGIKQSRWKELNESELKPMLNKPIGGAYPPGSTFKLITAIAAQEEGIEPSHKVTCRGSLWYGGVEFNCWKKEGHGRLDMRGAIKQSCDVYFWDLAQRIDIDKLAEVARRFGLGSIHDIGLGGQVAGTIPSREWKKKYYRSNPAQQTWFPGETLSVAIGQGALTTTPLQLAVMTSRLATGREVHPRLVRYLDGQSQPIPDFAPLPMDLQELEVVRSGMDAVVNEWGTAARSRLEKPEWRMAGKTGTSQVRSLQYDPVTGRRLKNYELPWKERDHALFVSYAPYENPRYAVAVVVEHGSSGSGTAGPKARDIMRAVLTKDPAKIATYAPKPGDFKTVLDKRQKREG